MVTQEEDSIMKYLRIARDTLWFRRHPLAARLSWRRAFKLAWEVAGVGR